VFWESETSILFLAMNHFSKNQLTSLREIMRTELGLELNDESVYDAAIAVVRFVCAKEMRQAGITTKAKGEKNAKGENIKRKGIGRNSRPSPNRGTKSANKK
jgi:hypothetical protein